MALIDELKEKLELVEATIAGHDADISEHRAAIEDLLVQRADLDIAMAALDPETYGDEDEAIPDEPELFDDAAADKSEFAEPEPVYIALDEQTCEPIDPFVEPKRRALTDMEFFAEADERARAAAIELTADVEPLPEPPEPMHFEVLPEPVWDERQPTEGYAPVTNPEADFWARGLAPSEPEKKHRFSIFGHKRETEEVS
jgi:hypothetical protein